MRSDLCRKQIKLKREGNLMFLFRRLKLPFFIFYYDHSNYHYYDKMFLFCFVFFCDAIDFKIELHKRVERMFLIQR